MYIGVGSSGGAGTCRTIEKAKMIRRTMVVSIFMVIKIILLSDFGCANGHLDARSLSQL